MSVSFTSVPKKKIYEKHPKGRNKVDLKVVLVGEADVGKTCLLVHYMERKFATTTTGTVGAAFLLKQWENRSIALWDTAGEERFSGLGSFYFRSAGATILAFDLTREESFTALRNRFLPLLQYTLKDCLIVLVGTKLDLVSVDRKRFSSARGKNFVKSLNPHLKAGIQLPYFETSSLTGKNVDHVFEYIFEYYFPSNAVTDKSPSQTYTPPNSGINLASPINRSNHSQCCT